MDANKQDATFIKIIANQQDLPPALLLAGHTDTLEKDVCNFLQHRLCALDGCGHCSICKQINTRQSANVHWIQPANTYTRDHLSEIFSTISFTLEENEECFFVIYKADMLTAACYNSLLKSIEEPPRGYHFIFLTERIKEVAKTIRSRCVIHQYAHAHQSLVSHPVAQFFVSDQKADAYTFMKTLESSALNEQESMHLVDDLIQYWVTRYKNVTLANNQSEIRTVQKILSILTQSLEEPITPGSSTIFWKTLFLQFNS